MYYANMCPQPYVNKGNNNSRKGVDIDKYLVEKDM